jgi:hypothetical protein
MIIGARIYIKDERFTIENIDFLLNVILPVSEPFRAQPFPVVAISTSACKRNTIAVGSFSN